MNRLFIAALFPWLAALGLAIALVVRVERLDREVQKMGAETDELARQAEDLRREAEALDRRVHEISHERGIDLDAGGAHEH